MAPRVWLLCFLIYALILAGLVALNGTLLALAVPLLVYLATGYLYRPAKTALGIERHLSADRVEPGTPVSVALRLTNRGETRLEEIFIEDIIPASLKRIAGPAALLTALEPGSNAGLEYTITGKRGYHRLEEVCIQTGETLGLFRRQERAAATAHFLVLPEVIRLRRVEIRPRATRVYSGQIPARQGGPGVEFFGVREYQPGDSLRWLNGRAAARHPRALFVNEFEQERVADVGLILDARRQSDSRRQGETLFEYSVQATAALAEAFLKGGNRVGLFVYGRSLDWTFPAYGKVQRERIMRALARAEPEDSPVFEKLDHLPARLFPTRSQLVLISPLLPDDRDLLVRLRAQGYRLLVISPDPVTFEERGLGQEPAQRLAGRLARLERNLLLRQLRQADIRVVDWQVEVPFQQVVYGALGHFYSQNG